MKVICGFIWITLYVDLYFWKSSVLCETREAGDEGELLGDDGAGDLVGDAGAGELVGDAGAGESVGGAGADGADGADGVDGANDAGGDGRAENQHDDDEASGKKGRSKSYQDLAVKKTKATTTKYRTHPYRPSFEEKCDFEARYCLRAHKTGELCGRTVYYRYLTFQNYCMLDYVNCMERFELWQVAYMAECFNISALHDYTYYKLDEDHLDVNVIEEYE